MHGLFLHGCHFVEVLVDIEIDVLGIGHPKESRARGFRSPGEDAALALRVRASIEHHEFGVFDRVEELVEAEELVYPVQGPQAEELVVTPCHDL